VGLDDVISPQVQLLLRETVQAGFASTISKHGTPPLWIARFMWKT